MNKNYSQLISNVLNRTNPENLPFTKSLSEELSTIPYNDIFRYITLAMNGVEEAYTNKSKEAGERVKNHLKGVLTQVTYRYQGSVMTNTHIRGNSDIDLLVITDKFYSFDEIGIQQTLSNPNQLYFLNESQIRKLKNELEGGNYSFDTALQDLRENRLKSENKLLNEYDLCETKHAKSIKITNKSLKRDVDIVIANWYDDTGAIIQDKNSDFRGIQVYNKQIHSRGNADYPFLSIKRINERSSFTNGRLKKMIRFLKNVKADSMKKIDLSSFDFNAICYDISTDKYQYSNKYDLVFIIYNQLSALSASEHIANNLKSVDEHEYIFRGNPDKYQSLKNILGEVHSIMTDLRQQLL